MHIDEYVYIVECMHVNLSLLLTSYIFNNHSIFNNHITIAEIMVKMSLLLMYTGEEMFILLMYTGDDVSIVECVSVEMKKSYILSLPWQCRPTKRTFLPFFDHLSQSSKHLCFH